MKKNFYLILLLIMISILFSACSTTKPISSKTIFQAATYLNPDINNQASPIVINIYQLNQSSAFMQASFIALYSDPAKALGKDLLDKEQIEIRPGEDFILNNNLMSTTQYLGIVAAFRNPDQAQWRTLINLPNKISIIKITINLASQSVTASKVKKGHFCIDNSCMLWI